MSPSLFLNPGRAWVRPGLRILLNIAVCVLAGWGVQDVVLVQQLEALRQQSSHRGEFYRRSLDSLLSRNESLPRIIAMEDRLKALLQNPGHEKLQYNANTYLLNVRDGADINAAYLMDKQGLTLASSNFQSPSSFVSNNYGYRPYFKEALKGRLGSFYGVGATTGEPGFFLAAPIEDNGETLGVVVVKISLDNFESALVKNGDPVFLVDANGVIFLTSVVEWKYRYLPPLEAGVLQQIGLSRQYDNRNLQPLGVNFGLQDEPQSIRIALPGAQEQDYLVQSIKTNTLDWSIVFLSLTKQERQNALLAGIAAGFAVAFLLSTLIYYQLNLKRYKERRQTEAALRQAHKELEQRIADRTADLRATNESLEERIDSLKATETILRETRDSAVQAGKLAVLGQMAAGISHEVNQPLTAMHTFTDNAVDLLDRGRLDEVRENLGFIKQMAVRMGHIVGEIKTFARKPPLERQEVHLAEVVNQAIMMVEPRRRQVAAQIDTIVLADDIRVLADVQRLEQVLVNLLLNALDAVTEADDKRLDISASCVNGQVSLVIHDHGPGIPAEVLSHLFEPFFTTKSSGQGLGLGLAISRMIIAEFGGKIDVRNHEAGGAEFTVVLEAA